jgi:D-alanine-D-alanine ligase
LSKVAVLMGGTSAERAVSLETGASIAGALRELGHEVVEVDSGPDLATRLLEAGPQIAFMALHGRGGEDGTVQGLLEIMRIPYTGCGVFSSAATMDKVVTKHLLDYHGVPVAPDRVLTAGDLSGAASIVSEELSFPVMVKPACEGSSIGVSRADDAAALNSALREVFERDDRALVEKFIDGRLFTIGVLGTDELVLPVLEIRLSDGFYDFDAKYNPGRSTYEVPAALPEEVAQYMQAMALDAFHALQCRGISRIDFMQDASSGDIFCLEINTIPGMTALSLIPMAAAAKGIDFKQVVSMVLDSAALKVDTCGEP